MPRVERHSGNSAKTLELEMEAMSNHYDAVFAKAKAERDDYLAAYEDNKKALEGVDRDDLGKDYADDWKTLMAEREDLHHLMDKYFNSDCSRLKD